MWTEVLLAAHALATFWMTGLIWFVQIVHYPLFDRVGREAFPRYEDAHTRRTGWVVGPPMLAELACALLLALQPAIGVSPAVPWIALGLLAVIWLSTAMLQVPRHRRLAAGFDSVAHRSLVATNWIRTVAWSLRSVAALWMLVAGRS